MWLIEHFFDATGQAKKRLRPAFDTAGFPLDCRDSLAAMRFTGIIAIILVLLVVAATGALWARSKDRTELPAGESVAELNARANDKTLSQEARARAVFTLFARHLPIGSTEDNVRRVLTNPAWLKESDLQKVTAIAGMIPIEFPLTGDSIFVLRLFPAARDKGWSPWIIYFRLSGPVSARAGLAYLEGKRVGGNPQLQEFALCFASRSDPLQGSGRIERLSAAGLKVFEESK